MYAASSYVNCVDTTPVVATDRLGGKTACLKLNCTHLPLLVAYHCDPLIYGMFPISNLLQLTPRPTGHIPHSLLVKIYITIANIHTINEFLIFTTSSTASVTTTAIFSNAES